MELSYQEAFKQCQLQHFDVAVEIFKMLPENDEILYNIATCYKERKTLESLTTAKERFVALLDKKDCNPQIKNNVTVNYRATITALTKYYLDRSDYQSAICITQEGIARLSDDHTLTYNLGFLLKSIGHYEAAVPALLHAKVLNPQHLDTYLELINIYHDTGNFSEWAQIIDEGLRALGPLPILYNELGVFLIKQQQYSKAVEIFQLGGAQEAPPITPGGSCAPPIAPLAIN